MLGGTCRISRFAVKVIVKQTEGGARGQWPQIAAAAGFTLTSEAIAVYPLRSKSGFLEAAVRNQTNLLFEHCFPAEFPDG